MAEDTEAASGRRNSSSSRTQPSRLSFLDSLRGLAAAYVLVFHTALVPTPQLEIPAWIRPFMMFGGSGVILFFVISAFSLCLTMDRHQRIGRPLASYMVSRFFRIAPLFYFLLGITLIRDAWVFGSSHSVTEIAASALFLFNFRPGWETGIVWASWTIGVEMPFYVVFPFLYATMTGVVGRLTLLAVSLIAWMIFRHALSLQSLSPEVSGAIQTYSALGFIPTFLIGMLTFDVYQHLSRHRLPNRLGAALIASGVLGLSLLISDLPVATIKFSSTLQALSYSLLLLGCALHAPSSLNNALWQFFGRISYSLYLWHPLIIFASAPLYQSIYAMAELPLTVRFLLACLWTLASVTAISYLSYRSVEQPAIELGKRLIKRLSDGSIDSAQRTRKKVATADPVSFAAVRSSSDTPLPTDPHKGT